jgi:hypothetical protein
MKQRIHMHDQVNNKVDDIMSHYNNHSSNVFVQLLKLFKKR